MLKTMGKVRRRVRRARERSGLAPVANRVSDERLTYLPARSLRNLQRCVERVGRDQVPGSLLEAGMAFGGSAIVIASLMPGGRRFHGYDVFGTIPAPSEKDDEKSHERYRVIASGESQGIKGGRYYGYEDDLYSKVVRNFEKYGLAVDGERISLHKGLFEDTMRFNGEQIALAHLDCDWYDSVRVCLERIYPNLSRGGYVISDDYHNYGGCTEAIDEFLAAHPDVRKVDDGQGAPDRSTNLILQRSDGPGRRAIARRPEAGSRY